MFKRIMSIVLSAATIVGFIPHIPAKSEEIEPYPYMKCYTERAVDKHPKIW